jgi:hypothetical protein
MFKSQILFKYFLSLIPNLNSRNVLILERITIFHNSRANQIKDKYL